MSHSKHCRYIERKLLAAENVISNRKCEEIQSVRDELIVSNRLTSHSKKSHEDLGNHVNCSKQQPKSKLNIHAPVFVPNTSQPSSPNASLLVPISEQNALLDSSPKSNRLKTTPSPFDQNIDVPEPSPKDRFAPTRAMKQIGLTRNHEQGGQCQTG